VLEGDAVKPHGDGDAADEGGVVLADQDHWEFTFHSSWPGLTRPSIYFEVIILKADGCPDQVRA
jgi:hypothetical protein